MYNIIEYVTNYNFHNVIWNKKRDYNLYVSTLYGMVLFVSDV